MQSKRKQNAVVGHTVDDSGKIEFKSEAGSFTNTFDGVEGERMAPFNVESLTMPQNVTS